MRAGHVLVVASIRDGSNTRASFIIYNSYIIRVSFCGHPPSWQNRLIVCQISMIVKIGDDCGSTLLCKDLLRIEKVSRLGFSEFRNRQRGNSISDWER